jgi:hypothetical protein
MSPGRIRPAPRPAKSVVMRSMRLAPALLMIATAASPCVALQSQSDRPERVVPAPVRALTVTGCLARGVEPNTFVLKNVAWPSPKTGSQGHAQGSAPATSPVSPPATWPAPPRLSGWTRTWGIPSARPARWRRLIRP